MLFRISVENAQDHVQALYVQKFADELRIHMSDVLDVRFYHSAQLFRDANVVAAMTRGSVEMAVPGTWQLDRFVPEISYFLLPQFYATDSRGNDDYLQSANGNRLLEKIERVLGAKIPGLWMDLGAAHIFTTDTQVSSFEDIADLRIRVAGGEANRLRINAFGGIGTIIAWPDLPPRIRDGSVDGVLTTFESIRSAELWNQGIQYVYCDSQYFPQYVPLVSARIFNRLPGDRQEQFAEIWNRIALEQREAAALAQDEARRIVESHGVEVTVPDAATQRQARNLLLLEQDEMILHLRIDRQYLPDQEN